MRSDVIHMVRIVGSAIVFCALLAWISQRPDADAGSAGKTVSFSGSAAGDPEYVEGGRALAPEDPEPLDDDPETMDEVFGVVRDDAGRAVPGATVVLARYGGGRRIAPFAADADGGFRLRNVLPGIYDVQVGHPAFPWERRDVPIFAPELELGLPRYGAVRLQVHVPDGEPRPDSIEIASHLGPPHPLGDGTIDVERLPPGLRLIRVRAPGFLTASAEVKILPGRLVGPVRMRLEAAYPVEVLVVGPHGAAIPGARLSVGASIWRPIDSGTTDADGRVVLEQFPRRAAPVSVSTRRSWYSGTTGVPTGSRKLRIHLASEADGDRSPPLRFEWLE